LGVQATLGASYLRLKNILYLNIKIHDLLTIPHSGIKNPKVK
jgi:hypothetical protein